MIGRKIAQQIAATRSLGGSPVSDLFLTDIVEPSVSLGGSISTKTAALNLVDAGAQQAIAAWRPDVIFHLAAVVSGEAEADFAKGYSVNVHATWGLLEALREADVKARVVFTSSLAVYGPPFPDPVPDQHYLTPKSSYGAQKAIGEFLLTDYSRKGFVDGISIRLPTIVVRPGAPNRAASSFLSGIIREPLAGQEAILPVSRDMRTWIASPKIAVDTLIHAAGLPASATAENRSLTGRGLSVSVDEMLGALRDVAGAGVVSRVKEVPDEAIGRIVGSWPRAFSTDTAKALGFPVDRDMRSIIKMHIADELGGKIAP